MSETKVPKIIHYFYDDIPIWEKSKKYGQFRMCYYSWKKHCPDYKIMLWHDKMPEFQEIIRRSVFVQKSYEMKLWAFVSDYVRLYALNKYGGIYLDTDVQLLSNFDKFLNDGFFCSIEGEMWWGKNIPEPAIMGGAPGHIVFRKAMEIYKSKEIFDMDIFIAPVVVGHALKDVSGFEKIPYKTDQAAELSKQFYDESEKRKQLDNFELYNAEAEFVDEKNDVHIYPSEYFCPTWCLWEEKAITDKTVAIHWNQSTWQNLGKLIKLKYFSRNKLFNFFEKLISKLKRPTISGENLL